MTSEPEDEYNPLPTRKPTPSSVILLLGIASFFSCGLAGVPAISLGLKDWKLQKSAFDKVLTIIGMVLGVLAIILSIVVFVMTSHLVDAIQQLHNSKVEY
jgi:hypothetical protein